MSKPGVAADSEVRTGRADPAFVKITAEERAREVELRGHFARFWGSATGDPRAVYDTFIAATPLVDGLTHDAVEERDVRGWWVRPARAEPGHAILFVHGGAYIKGS